MKHELFEAQSLYSQKLFDELNFKISEMGFNGVLYSFYPKPMYMNKTIQPVLHYSDSLSPFIAHYIENNYGNSDFVLRLALEGRSEPVDWWHEVHHGGVSRAEKRVTEDARRYFNIQHGLSIPVLFGTFAIAGISVISHNPDEAYFQRLKNKSINKLRKLATQYHSEIIKSTKELNYFILPLLENLTPTKRKVIKHLLSGHPMKRIEEIYGIKQKYAEKVLADIRQEFGGISANELIYILGMINIIEYL